MKLNRRQLRQFIMKEMKLINEVTAKEMRVKISDLGRNPEYAYYSSDGRNKQKTNARGATAYGTDGDGEEGTLILVYGLELGDGKKAARALESMGLSVKILSDEQRKGITFSTGHRMKPINFETGNSELSSQNLAAPGEIYDDYGSYGDVPKGPDKYDSRGFIRPGRGDERIARVKDEFRNGVYRGSSKIESAVLLVQQD